MDRAMQAMPGVAANAVEIVVHVTEDLGELQQHQVVSALEKTDGILGAGFCSLRNHLVVATYNKDVFSSQDVLKSFRALNLDARLIGPI